VHPDTPYSVTPLCPHPTEGPRVDALRIDGESFGIPCCVTFTAAAVQVYQDAFAFRPAYSAAHRACNSLRRSVAALTACATPTRVGVASSTSSVNTGAVKRTSLPLTRQQRTADVAGKATATAQSALAAYTTDDAAAAFRAEMVRVGPLSACGLLPRRVVYSPATGVYHAWMLPHLLPSQYESFTRFAPDLPLCRHPRTAMEVAAIADAATQLATEGKRRGGEEGCLDDGSRYRSLTAGLGLVAVASAVNRGAVLRRPHGAADGADGDVGVVAAALTWGAEFPTATDGCGQLHPQLDGAWLDVPNTYMPDAALPPAGSLSLAAGRLGPLGGTETRRDNRAAAVARAAAGVPRFGPLQGATRPVTPSLPYDPATICHPAKGGLPFLKAIPCMSDVVDALRRQMQTEDPLTLYAPPGHRSASPAMTFYPARDATLLETAIVAVSAFTPAAMGALQAFAMDPRDLRPCLRQLMWGTTDLPLHADPDTTAVIRAVLDRYCYMCAHPLLLQTIAVPGCVIQRPLDATRRKRVVAALMDDFDEDDDDVAGGSGPDGSARDHTAASPRETLPEWRMRAEAAAEATIAPWRGQQRLPPNMMRLAVFRAAIAWLEGYAVASSGGAGAVSGTRAGGPGSPPHPMLQFLRHPRSFHAVPPPLVRRLEAAILGLTERETAAERACNMVAVNTVLGLPLFPEVAWAGGCGGHRAVDAAAVVAGDWLHAALQRLTAETSHPAGRDAATPSSERPVLPWMDAVDASGRVTNPAPGNAASTSSTERLTLHLDDIEQGGCDDGDTASRSSLPGEEGSSGEGDSVVGADLSQEDTPDGGETSGSEGAGSDSKVMGRPRRGAALAALGGVSRVRTAWADMAAAARGDSGSENDAGQGDGTDDDDDSCSRSGPTKNRGAASGGGGGARWRRRGRAASSDSDFEVSNSGCVRAPDGGAIDVAMSVS